MTLKNKFPGVGSYNLTIDNSRMRRAPSISMGREKRGSIASEKEQKMRPGVGSHNLTLTLKKSAPSFGFGTSQRPSLTGKFNTPAPGAYKLPTRIADVPNHSGAKGKADFHYV
jgi:hypothetical protein